MNKETELMNELEDFDAVVVNTPYPAALAPRSSDSAGEPWGVVVPDLPGCKASGATQEEAMANAVDSVAAWIASARNDSRDVAPPSLMDVLARMPEYAGWTFFFVGTTGLLEVDHARVAEATAEAPEPEPRLAADPMPLAEPDPA